MVEMKMRIDDEIDALRVTADRFQARADIFALAEIEAEELGERWSDARCRIPLAVGMHTGIE